MSTIAGRSNQDLLNITASVAGVFVDYYGVIGFCVAMLHKRSSRNLFEDGSRKRRKRKPDAQEIIDPTTSTVKETSFAPTETVSQGLPERQNSGLREEKTRVSPGKTEQEQEAQAPKSSVSFRDLSVAETNEHDLKHEKNVRKSKFWGKLFPSSDDDKMSTDPEVISIS